MNPWKLIQEYRAQLTTHNPTCVVSITGATAQDVQNTISTLLKGKSRFENQQNTVLVFNAEHFEGKQPIGWIAEYEVPEQMSVQTTTSHRLELLRRAA